MAIKSVYVSSEDETLWEQAGVAAARARRSVAWVVHEALRTYLRELALQDERDRLARDARPS
jgi:hypothetical protein